MKQLKPVFFSLHSRGSFVIDVGVRLSEVVVFSWLQRVLGVLREAGFLGLRPPAPPAQWKLFVIFWLHPWLLHMYGEYNIVYNGEMWDKVRRLASTYVMNSLPYKVEAPQDMAGRFNKLWIKIEKDGCLYTVGAFRARQAHTTQKKQKKHSTSRGRVKGTFQRIMEEPTGGWMMLAGHAGEISILSSVPRWGLDSTPEKEWEDTAFPLSLNVEEAGDWKYTRKWHRRVPLVSDESIVLIIR